MKNKPGFIASIVTAVFCLPLCCNSVAAQEQEKTPEFEAKVRLVEVTVQAKDSDGLHVTDLTKEEFELHSDGKRRELGVFEPVQVGLERFRGLKKLGVDYRTLPEKKLKALPPRYFILFFHQIQFRFGTFQRAKQAALDFINNHMLPNDFVSVVGFDKKVDFELDFSNDQSEVISYIDNMHLKHRNIKWHSDFYIYLQELAHRVSKIPHKITLILIAEGMKGIGGPAKFRVYDNTIQMLQAADIRVFGVDAGGLNLKDPGASVARLSPQIAAKINQSFNLGLYSEPTGGRYFRYHNNILNLFSQVDYEISAYYILGFYLGENETIEDTVSIKVTTSRSGVDLLYKKRFRPLLKPDQEAELSKYRQ